MRVVDLFQCGTFELDGTDCDVTVERLLQGNSRITVEGKGVGYHGDDNNKYNSFILLVRFYAEKCYSVRRLRSCVPWLLKLPIIGGMETELTSLLTPAANILKLQRKSYPHFYITESYHEKSTIYKHYLALFW